MNRFHWLALELWFHLQPRYTQVVIVISGQRLGVVLSVWRFEVDYHKRLALTLRLPIVGVVDGWHSVRCDAPLPVACLIYGYYGEKVVVQ